MFSPVVLALFAYIVFVVSVLIPPNIYISIIPEQNFMFLDIRTIALQTICTFAFCGGYYFFSGPSRERSVDIAIASTRISLKPLYVVLPVLAATALNMVSITTIAGNSAEALTQLLQGGGSSLKDDLNVEGGLTQASVVSIGLLWWAWYQYIGSNKWSVISKRQVKAVLLFATAVTVTGCVIKLARYELFPLIIGLGMIYWLSALRKGNTASTVERKIIIRVSLLLVGIFAAFSILRGAEDIGGIFGSLFGYGPASYNRMAAMVNGYTSYPYAGTGAYGIPFLGNMPLIRDTLAQVFWPLPDAYLVFRSEFTAATYAGLSPAYNWLGSFGFYLLDFGWFGTPIFAFFMGGTGSLLWHSFLKGKGLGVAFYPFFAFTTVMWSTSNLLMQPRMIAYLGTALLVALYEATIRYGSGNRQSMRV